MVFSSDNGGREDNEFGGNNYPLRGMKFTDFEGGVRVASFVSGGLVPSKRRGSIEPSLIHITDWYSTFSYLAGVPAFDYKAAASHAGIPRIDSINMWETVAEGKPSSRSQIAISSSAIIQWPFKLVLGNQGGKGVYTGTKNPNSTKLVDNDPGCGEKGCLFNIEVDPTEHHDVGTENPAILNNLTTTLYQILESTFQTNEIPGYTNCTTVEEYTSSHHGFGGPLCYKPIGN